LNGDSACLAKWRHKNTKNEKGQKRDSQRAGKKERTFDSVVEAV
jgi:hypothetical protein